MFYEKKVLKKKNRKKFWVKFLKVKSLRINNETLRKTSLFLENIDWGKILVRFVEVFFGTLMSQTG